MTDRNNSIVSPADVTTSQSQTQKNKNTKTVINNSNPTVAAANVNTTSSIAIDRNRRKNAGQINMYSKEMYLTSSNKKSSRPPIAIPEGVFVEDIEDFSDETNTKPPSQKPLQKKKSLPSVTVNPALTVSPARRQSLITDALQKSVPPSSLSTDPVSPKRPILLPQFLDPSLRLGLLFDLCDLLPPEFHYFRFLVNAETIGGTFFARLLGCLRTLAVQHDFYLMALSVIKEAFSGTPPTRHEPLDDLCQAIRTAVGDHPSIASLCAGRPLTKVTPLFLALFAPAVYAEVFIALDVPIFIDSHRWPSKSLAAYAKQMDDGCSLR